MKNWEEYDQERVRSAVAEIKRSANLRFLFRHLLAASEIQSQLPSENALSIARVAGRQDVGYEIVSVLRAHQPGLWPDLMKEEENEQMDRTKPVSQRPNRGFASRNAPDDSDNSSKYD